MSSTTPNTIVLQGLEGNAPVHLIGMQQWLAPHVEMLQFFWWMVFAVVLLTVVWKMVRQQS